MATYTQTIQLNNFSFSTGWSWISAPQGLSFYATADFQTDDINLLSNVVVNIFAVNNGSASFTHSMNITAKLDNGRDTQTHTQTSTYNSSVPVSNNATNIATLSFNGIDIFNERGKIPSNNSQIECEIEMTLPFDDDASMTGEGSVYYRKSEKYSNVLDEIPMASTIFCSSARLGEPVTITIANKLFEKSSSGTVYNPKNTITYQFGAYTETVVSQTTATSIQWTLPNKFLSEYENDEIQKVGILTCHTYGGYTNDPYGTTTCEFVALLPTGELVPVLTPIVTDVNSETVALTGNNKRLIRYKSHAQYAINAVAVKGATIVSQQVKNGSTVINNQSNGTIEAVESGTFEFLAVDSRNMGTAMTMITPQFVEYIKLTCSQNVELDITSELGATANISISGNYFNGSFGAQSNTIKLELRQTQNDGTMGEWGDITVLISSMSGGRYSATFSASGLRYDIPYTFQSRATDVFGTVTTSEQTIRVLPVFDWSDQDFNFNVPVSFNSGLDVPSKIGIGSGCSVENEENNLVLKSDAAVEITSRNDMTLSATGDLHLNGDNVYFNRTPLTAIESGSWNPTVQASNAVQSYSVQEGWYERIGSTVTIGFLLTIITQNDFSSQVITINGLPFTPAYTAFGGGVCSNAIASAGMTFQCWAANTNGTITARVQDCNNTEKTNISTSASGLFYAKSGVTMTLGGTISYMIAE